MKDAQVKNKRRLDELNYFNAISCLFVILIHVLSLGINRLDNTSTALAIVYMPWKIAAYVVPGFLFTGAVKMALGFESPKKTSYLKYILRRITKIYVPFLIYTLLFYGFYIYIGWYKFSFKNLLEYFMWGNIASPFYYVITVMQFYILMPFWRFLVKKVSWFTAVPTAALITFFAYRLSPLLGSMGITFNFSDRVFPTYLFFWVVGLYVGKNYSTVYDAIINHKKSLLFCCIPAVVFSYMNLWQYRNGIFVYGTDANCMKMISDILSIFFVLCVCIFIKNSKAEKTKKLLGFIFSASFSVYLSHCLFLVITERVISVIGITDIGIQLIVRFAVCYTIPFLWYVITKYSKKFVFSLFTKLKTLLNTKNKASV